MDKSVTKRLLPAALLATGLVFVTALTGTHAVEPQQTLYKWTDATGQTQYTQTPPEADIPFEEVNDEQTREQTMYSRDTDSTNTAQMSSNDQLVQEDVPNHKPEDSFSPMPQNARIIPNSYRYGSGEYNVSPTKAALDKSRGD